MRPPAPVPSLGVGITYQPRLQRFIERHIDLLDYLEVEPDALWVDRGAGASPRYLDDPRAVEFLTRFRQHLPVIPHSVGLSIGAARQFRHEHVAQMRRWHERLDFPWHSDHLACDYAHPVGDHGVTSVTMQVPRDRESLAQIVPRARKVCATVSAPFALENNAGFFDFDDEEFDDAEFLNRLCAEADCYLVLDLNNLYTSSCRRAGDPMDTLARLDLERVIEIHVAGACENGTAYGETPDAVLDLLRCALLSCPNVGGVTFEVLGAWYEVMGELALCAELDKLRRLWRRYQPLPSRLAS